MKRVVVLGCCSWGTAIVKVVADNVASSDEFFNEVYWFVRDEDYNGRNLISWINEDHVNPLYLPIIRVPYNVIAFSDIQKVTEEADIILVSYPPCYITWLLDNMKQFIKENAYFVSFCKGLILCPEENRIKLVSDFIREQTGKRCVVVIGATTAIEVAKQQLTEATIGSKSLEHGLEVKRLLQTDYIKLVITQDDVGVELCGALKNAVAIAAGICNGLELGNNTKAAVLRIGFWEVSELMKELFPGRVMSYRSEEIQDIGSDLDFLNIILRRELSTSEVNKSSLHSLSAKELRRIFVDGVEYAKQIYNLLAARRRTAHFPLFVTVHRICQNEAKPQELITCLQSHPIHAEHQFVNKWVNSQCRYPPLS